MKKLGLAALGCYSIHAGFHILNGCPEEVLWMCHLEVEAGFFPCLYVDSIHRTCAPLHIVELAGVDPIGSVKVEYRCTGTIVQSSVGMTGRASSTQEQHSK
ncbi:MAG: hypothetical protein AABO57_17905 [Acidobacteriota bacterium]